MIPTLLRLGVDALWLIIVGALAVAFYRGLRWAVLLVPLPYSVRGVVRRAVPFLGALLLLLYLVFAVRRTLVSFPEFVPWAIAAIGLAFISFAYASLKDLANGFFFRVSENCEPGDSVRIDDVEGEVLSLGVFGVSLQTAKGDEAVVPYSRLVQATLIRRSEDNSLHGRAFRLQFEESIDEAVAARTVRDCVLLNHWSSPGKQPRVEVVERGEIEATVFPIQRARGLDIEDAARRALAELNAAEQTREATAKR